MTTAVLQLTRPAAAPWRDDPAGYWGALTTATAHLDTPLGAIDATALAANAYDMLERAQGTPIRVASKSVRVRGVVDAVLALPGYRGVLAYTLAEALWLAETGIQDVVVGYPTADRGALTRLATSQKLASRVTVMIDDIAQLDLIDAVVPKHRTIRVCLELDASLDAPILGHLGVRRSPVHTPAQARALAEAIVTRDGFELVGMMAYEAQIAGLTNKGKPVIQAMQRTSIRELRDRRGEAVRRVREIADLEFVNGGGTGSLESTHADDSVTEIAAGSGLFGSAPVRRLLAVHAGAPLPPSPSAWCGAPPPTSRRCSGAAGSHPVPPSPTGFPSSPGRRV